MKREIVEALEVSLQKFPRLSGILLGIILHPVFSALIAR